MPRPPARPLSLLLLLTLPLTTAGRARATEVRVSAGALERTLRTQLFTAIPPDAPGQPRYYMRGDLHSPCFVYADTPQVEFRDDRVVVHVHTRARIGTPLHGTCLGLTLSTDAEVSFVPVVEAESIGFRDARIERLSESKELNFLLVPFLSRKLPAQMSINAAELMRKLLSRSPEQTGYTFALSSLKLHSMLVQENALTLDLDANLHVD